METQVFPKNTLAKGRVFGGYGVIFVRTFGGVETLCWGANPLPSCRSRRNMRGRPRRRADRGNDTRRFRVVLE